MVKKKPTHAVENVPEPKKWVPDIGTFVSAHLPHEIIRARVDSHIDDDTITVKLVQPPLSKTHSYRINQTVVLHRVNAQMSGYNWEAPE